MVKNEEEAKMVIDHVVITTKVRWLQYGEKYLDLDEIFIRRGYEQKGFECWKFMKILKNRDIRRIGDLGAILTCYDYDGKYEREISGSLNSSFYKDLKEGKCGDIGKKFFDAVEEALNTKFSKGSTFYKLLWYMLKSCKVLKIKYNSSFDFFLQEKYSEFTNMKDSSKIALRNISKEDWSVFLGTKPWNELPGIGENAFDFILGDVGEFKFASESYKLDDANKHFLKVTGINNLIINKGKNRTDVIDFLKSLEMNYTLREINKGIYTYCSGTEKRNFGFCRSFKKCIKCGINMICEKNL